MMMIRRAITLIAITILTGALMCGAAVGQVNQEMIDRCLAGEIDEANATWWGFDPEDATEALQSAINSGVEKLVVEDMGTPWVVTPIELASNQEIIFEEGCEILAKRGEFKARNDTLFTARNVENVTLRGYGATFRMWQEDYDNPELYDKAEWRHCLAIRASSNISVLGLTLRDSGGDGIYLGRGSGAATNTDVHIRDVVCDNNYRQGISVITAENLLIEDTIMRNTSGTPPQAGIDFEPNRPEERLVNVVMRNCLTENNNSSGYTFYLRPMTAESTPVSVRIENCRSVGDLGHGARVITDATLDGSVTGTIEFVDCVFEDTRQPGISVVKPAARGLVRFERCKLINTGGTAETRSPIMLMSRMGADAPVGGVEFVDVEVHDPVDRIPMRYVDQAGGTALEDISGNLILVGEDGSRTNVELTEDVLAEWMPVTQIQDIPRLDLDTGELVPLVSDSPEAATDARWPVIRRHGDFLLYANEGDEVSFTVSYTQVGKSSGTEMPIEIVAPSGEVAHEAGAAFQEQTEVTFTAPETGVYTMSLDPGSNRFQFSDSSHPLNISGAEGPVRFIGMNKDLIFYVPEGTEEFGVRVFGDNAGEALAATLLNPMGEVVGEVDNQFELHQFHVELDEPSDGEVWTLQIRKPSDITWEDHYVDLRGILPVLAPAGTTLLVPAE
ncbi:MAG: right-handed parallel beta-helix repeat-containing protein [Armatimonadota bacterium]